MSRSSVKLPKEHFTVAFARNLAGTASAFEVIEEEYENGNDKYPARTYYGGLFLGPEKIFLGDPVRILRKPKPVPKEGVVAEDSEDGDNEDVLVVEKIFNDASKSTLPPDADSGRRRTHNVISIRGSVYTHYPDEMSRDFELSPQEFAQLPYRMRQPDMYGELKPWYARSASTERGICSIKFINGRWYEPAALKAWGIPALLPKPSLKKRYESRGDALGWDHLNGIQLIGPEDRIHRPAAELANPPSSTPTKGSSNVNVYGDKMDIDGDNGPVMTSPTSNFISVNGPESNSAIKMSMTLAALRDNMADDDNEIEEEDEEQVVTEKTLGQVFSSPKKRLYMRQK